MALAWKDSRQPVSPNVFHFRQNAWLVIDHYVVPGWITLFDIIQHTLFMNIDKHSTTVCVPQS